MTTNNSTDSSKDEPTARFRTILKGDEEELPHASESPRSVLDLLPRAQKSASPPPGPRHAPAKPSPKAEGGLTSRKERYRRAFWDVTSGIGLVIDVILIAVIILLLLYVRNLNLKVNELLSMVDMPVETVRGLYTNFEKMEAAHIVTQIPVSTTVPVKLDVCIRTGTSVVINQEVIIPDARVTVQTGGLNITNASTRIILPSNTSLPVNLDLCVPVETAIPVALNVDVDIPLAQTDLAVPFLGLQDTLEPLYCLLDPTAVDSKGTLICAKAETP